MAYNYDDFVTAANTAGMMNKFTQQDLAAAQKNPEYGLSMLSLMKDYDSSETEEQRLLATEAANQLRKTYGVVDQAEGSFSGAAAQTPTSAYSGGYDDQIKQTLGLVGNYGDFAYSGEDAYQKQLQSIITQQPFSYDPEKDPRFAAYKKAYLREGDRATAKALAQASTATGGVPSSYAVTAATQAGNYYAGKLADIIPELYEDGYNQYLNDFQLKLNGLGALQDDRNFNYQTYLDRYNMLKQSLADLQQQEQTEYNRYVDQWNMDRSDQQQKWQNAMALYQNLGYMPDDVMQTLLGYKPLTTDQIMELQRVLGVTADGIYGSLSQKAAGGLTAEDAYQRFVLNGETVPMTGVGNRYTYNPVPATPNGPDFTYDPNVDQTPSWLRDTGSDGTANYTVTNKTGDTWVLVDGNRYTWTEVYSKVQEGTMTDTIDRDKGTITFSKVK